MSARSIPPYQITPKIAKDLLRIEAAKEQIAENPLTPMQLAAFQERTRFSSAYYSTMIEGNRLEPEQVCAILKNDIHFDDHENDIAEIKGYHAALVEIKEWIKNKEPIGEEQIQILHALVVSGEKNKDDPYRIGQNLVYNNRTRTIAYIPPEAEEVPSLVRSLIAWINEPSDTPCPVIAGISQFQLYSIHPFSFGNGLVARLLATYVLRLGGYDLDALGVLEEYYATNLNAYFEAIMMSPLHNYFLGCVEVEMTPWLHYFVEGLAVSMEKVAKKIEEAKRNELSAEAILTAKLDSKQLKALAFFREFTTVQANQIR